MDDMPDIDMDDLQAAIDASAHATVDKKKKPKAAEPEVTTKAEVVEEPAEDQSTVVVEAPAAEESEVLAEEVPKESPSENIAVTVGVSEPEAADPEEDEASEEHSIAVTIGQKTDTEAPEEAIETAEPDVEEENKPAVISVRKGRTIMPASAEVADETEEASEPKPAPKPAPMAHDIIPVRRPTKPDEAAPEPTQAEQEPEPKPKTEIHERRIEPLSQDIAPTQPEASTPGPEASAEEDDSSGEQADGLEISTQQKAPAKDSTSAKSSSEKDESAHIFNSKEYHLPIKASRHHRKGQLRPLQVFAIVFIIIAAVGGFAIVDEGFRSTITGGLLATTEDTQEN